MKTSFTQYLLLFSPEIHALYHVQTLYSYFIVGKLFWKCPNKFFEGVSTEEAMRPLTGFFPLVNATHTFFTNEKMTNDIENLHIGK